MAVFSEKEWGGKVGHGGSSCHMSISWDDSWPGPFVNIDGFLDDHPVAVLSSNKEGHT